MCNSSLVSLRYNENKLKKLHGQIAGVQKTMEANIKATIERGDNLDELESNTGPAPQILVDLITRHVLSQHSIRDLLDTFLRTTADLLDNANDFKGTATRLKRFMCCKNAKVFSHTF
jgi:hypothetical protein